MGHLYYTELNIDGGGSLNNLDNFQNLIPLAYRSGTEIASITNVAWSFGFGDGGQGAGSKNVSFYGLAVRSGDVAADPIPEPGTMVLMGFGLAIYRVRRRRQRR